MHNTQPLGLWLIGAKGGVATTVIAGLLAMRERLVPEIGLVSGLPQFAHLPWTPWNNIVVGGHEIRATPLVAAVESLVRPQGILDRDVFVRIAAELHEIDRNVRPGSLWNCSPAIARLADLELPNDASAARAVERLTSDLTEFIALYRLRHLVVVNVASTEPPLDIELPPSWAELEPLLTDTNCPLPASCLYAIAAFRVGASYINFTPSLGASAAALDDLCLRSNSRHYGCDGKTGETLMKSVLAPMFARRNLQVMSWVGHNIFGNSDGLVLADPANKRSKVASKDHLIGDILGYRPQTHVSIEYIASLGDWKTAWDHIHFRGFLGVPMTLQFIWQGCDSALAAPLVLDLARLTDIAQRIGHVGRMEFLAPYFKSPIGMAEQAFDRQFALLEDWAMRASTAAAETRGGTKASAQNL